VGQKKGEMADENMWRYHLRQYNTENENNRNIIELTERRWRKHEMSIMKKQRQLWRFLAMKSHYGIRQLSVKASAQYPAKAKIAAMAASSEIESLEKPKS